VIWPCIKDKLAHFDGFADDMTSKISLAGVVAGKAGLVQAGVAACEAEEASPVVLQQPRTASLPMGSGSSKMQLLRLEVQWVAVDMTCWTLLPLLWAVGEDVTKLGVDQTALKKL